MVYPSNLLHSSISLCSFGVMDLTESVKMDLYGLEEIYWVKWVDSEMNFVKVSE